MERFVVDTEGADEGALATGLSWLVERGRAGEDVAIIVPTVSSIPNLGGAIGKDGVAQAKENREVTIDAVVIAILTARTAPSTFSGALLVPWASEEMVARGEALGPTAVCATGWVPGALDGWKSAFAPEDLRVGAPEAPRREMSAAVRGLLAGLVDVLHPNDKKRVLTGLLAIRAEGIEIDPPVIRAAALELGWSQRAAGRLRAIAEKVTSGAAVRRAERLDRRQQRELVARLASVAPDE
jgi:hypothetical protein